MVEAEIVLKKARTSGAAEHGSAVVTNARVTVHPLPDTLDDVATEDVSTLAKDKTPLDDVIAKLKAAGHDDPRGAEILAAAITLRDSSGRDRQAALRSMANTWGVT